jgi:hypothetical protein
MGKIERMIRFYNGETRWGKRKNGFASGKRMT